MSTKTLILHELIVNLGLGMLMFVLVLVAGQDEEVCLQLTPSPSLEKFVDPLPTPPIIVLPTNSTAFVLSAYKIQQKLHRDMPQTTLYAFGQSKDQATYPGPTLIAHRNIATRIRWENHLTDSNHTLMLDQTLDTAQPKMGIPLVVHLHGMETKASSDGHPDAWFTNSGQVGSGYVTQDYWYPNSQPTTMLWYHDHTFGYTRLNVAAGLAGLYLILSTKHEPEWVPKHLREPTRASRTGQPGQNELIHHMMVQDKQFYDNGTIKYPVIGINPTAHPNWCPDYFGDVVLVNGKVWPYLNVSRDVHRFRVLNGGNSRFFVFNLTNPSLKFIKIGTDGGYMSNPLEQKQLTLAPAERVDFMIDFSAVNTGENVTLLNVGAAPFPSGPMLNQTVMMFKVIDSQRKNRVTIPVNDSSAAAAAAVNRTIEEVIIRTTGFNISTIDFNRVHRRQFVLGLCLDSSGGFKNLFSDGMKTFRDPPTELIKLYSTEVWEFINSVPGVAHPMHLHLVNFIVLNQQAYNNTRFTAKDCFFNATYPDPKSCYTEAPQPPDTDQLGWKDTAVVQPFVVTRFLIKFRPRDRNRFTFDPTKSPGYIWHCHLLEHEDNEMMRPLLFSFKA